MGREEENHWTVISGWRSHLQHNVYTLLLAAWQVITKQGFNKQMNSQPTSRHSGEDEDEKGNEGSLYPKEIYPLLLGNVAFVFIPRCHWLDLKSVDSGFIVQSVILSGISRRMIIIVSISYQCTAPHPLAQQAPALAMRMTKGFLNRSSRREEEHEKGCWGTCQLADWG